MLLFLLIAVFAIATSFRLKALPSLNKTARRWRYFEVAVTWLVSVPLLAFPLLIIEDIWPPLILERHEQRQAVLKRVELAGGWAAMKKDAESLAKQNEEEGFQWVRGHSYGEDTNYQLPATIAALKPQTVEYFSPRLFQALNNKEQFKVVRIKIFGNHATGGHSTPYYGLEIVMGARTNDYCPQPSHAASGNARSTYRLVAENIYEVY